MASKESKSKLCTFCLKPDLFAFYAYVLEEVL